MSAGLDSTEYAILAAALAQHDTLEEADGLGDAAGTTEGDTDHGNGVVGGAQLASDELGPATAFRGLNDVHEALCCPITHVRPFHIGDMF
jgi:hypothetical protein